jgi:hypothetical protein
LKIDYLEKFKKWSDNMKTGRLESSSIAGIAGGSTSTIPAMLEVSTKSFSIAIAIAIWTNRR